jgi:hypothetical protein
MGKGLVICFAMDLILRMTVEIEMLSRRAMPRMPQLSFMSDVTHWLMPSSQALY